MIFRKYSFFLLIFFISNCAEKSSSKDDNAKAASNDSIPDVRKTINKKPVDKYIVQMGNIKLDRKFGVEVFETAQTFKYLLLMYYDGITETDTLVLPNFGTWPVVKVKPGNDKLSCIIGFLDKKKEFREYKMLSLKDDKLRLTALKTYGVATYSK